jgi:protein-S-isoprenylcysteine O-methyltransferase Ste14
VDPVLFRDSTAQTVATVSAGTLGIAEAGLQWRTRATHRVASDRGTYRLFGIAMVSGVAIALRGPDWVPGLSLSGGAWWPYVVGLVLFWAGVTVRWWGVLTLGRFFQLTVVIQEGHRVVQDGPYRWIRHPGYSGTVLLFLGVGFACDNLLSVVACPGLTLIGLLRRVHVEEAELTRQLGDAYRDYARRTRRLIPGVW